MRELEKRGRRAPRGVRRGCEERINKVEEVEGFCESAGKITLGR